MRIKKHDLKLFEDLKISTLIIDGDIYIIRILPFSQAHNNVTSQSIVEVMDKHLEKARGFIIWRLQDFSVTYLQDVIKDEV